MTVSRFAASPYASDAPELADVLHSLGHDCPLGCARASDELGATVWSTRTGMPVAGWQDPTLVVVDSSRSLAPPSRSSRLIHFVDGCARSDGIRVRERRASDSSTSALLL